jgi:hypothetical protein
VLLAVGAYRGPTPQEWRCLNRTGLGAGRSPAVCLPLPPPVGYAARPLLSFSCSSPRGVGIPLHLPQQGAADDSRVSRSQPAVRAFVRSRNGFAGAVLHKESCDTMRESAPEGDRAIESGWLDHFWLDVRPYLFRCSSRDDAPQPQAIALVPGRVGVASDQPSFARRQVVTHAERCRNSRAAGIRMHQARTALILSPSGGRPPARLTETKSNDSFQLDRLVGRVKTHGSGYADSD